ncbi:MAG: Gfo/Idh/MocA family oxidoreductase [Candidatus Omnitrophica bacterium]|nr:Gfo/Idh/MocA family oxidoreductase [Candidatus Omnitrophota bacterium]
MSSISRRNFIGASTTAAVGTALTAVAATAEEKKVSENDKLNIALIGCGGMGGGDLRDHLKTGETNCVAVCDVDDSHANEKANQVEEHSGKRPDIYKDFRKVLDRDDIDTVIVATPDHWHALIAISACQAGKDVYCEKPLATSIHEGRVMVDAAEKYGRIVQIGTQQRSAEHYGDAIDFVKSGKLGKIRLIKAWAYLDWKGELPPKPDSDPPEGVDYDFWLGPAPKRPFNENRFHFNFRWYWDYSGGLMTDWGAHMIDIAAWGLEGMVPKSAMSVGGKFGYPDDAQQTPDTQQAIVEYDGISLVWEHALGVGRGPFDREHGVAFHGNNGILIVDRGGWEVWPETDKTGIPTRVYKMEGVPRQDSKGDYHLTHVQNFIDCVKSREKPNASIEIAHWGVLPCHLANIAVRTGRTIQWDNDKEQIVGDDEANKLVSREYRDPWKLPTI